MPEPSRSLVVLITRRWIEKAWLLIECSVD
jgi:hypothetical protein